MGQKKKTHRGTAYSEVKRNEALRAFLVSGSSLVVSRITGIHVNTVDSWRKQDWWNEGLQRLREDDNLQIGSRLRKVLDVTIDQMHDRIENGDHMYNPRTGKLERVPAKLRDITHASNSIIDKKLLLEKKVEEQKEQASIEEKLMKLAEAFKSFIPENKKEKVIEGEYLAVHDQRKEGLFEGASMGAREETETC